MDGIPIRVNNVFFFFLCFSGASQGTSSTSTVSKKTSVILPTEVELPSPDVEYKGLTESETTSLQAALTKEFYFNVSRYLSMESLLVKVIALLHSWYLRRTSPSLPYNVTVYSLLHYTGVFTKNIAFFLPLMYS